MYKRRKLSIKKRMALLRSLRRNKGYKKKGKLSNTKKI